MQLTGFSSPRPPWRENLSVRDVRPAEDDRPHPVVAVLAPWGADGGDTVRRAVPGFPVDGRR
ncbi:hypothetical protein GCM10027300_04070 [Modestobacter lapidis]